MKKQRNSINKLLTWNEIDNKTKQLQEILNNIKYKIVFINKKHIEYKDSKPLKFTRKNKKGK